MTHRSSPRAPVALVGATPALLAALRPAAETLAGFGVPFAERTPGEALAGGPRAVIVASADGTLAAELASGGEAPVIRVPVGSEGAGPALDLLTGPAAWPAGPASHATVAIGEAGARNAALLVVSILALDDERLRAQWDAFRADQTAAVLNQPLFRA